MRARIHNAPVGRSDIRLRRVICASRVICPSDVICASRVIEIICFLMKSGDKMTIDNEYIKNLQHALHRIPELGFDLPRTVAFVKGELDKIGIPYTEKYGKSSIVAELNPEKTNFTIAIRADMDALAIVEQSGVEYSSEIEGRGHNRSFHTQREQS